LLGRENTVLRNQTGTPPPQGQNLLRDGGD
jgi:hypothetical protein